MNLMDKKPLDQKHIFVGQVKDVDVFYAAQSTNWIVKWAVPVTASKGEKGVFLLPRVLGDRAAFVSVGVITSCPEEDGNKWTKWGAKVSIEAFNPAFEPVELSVVQNQLIEWNAIQGRSPWNRSFVIDPDFYTLFINELKKKQSYSVASQFDQAIR